MRTGGLYHQRNLFQYCKLCTEILELTHYTKQFVTTAITACDTFTWSVNGLVYTTSGTYSNRQTVLPRSLTYITPEQFCNHCDHRVDHTRELRTAVYTTSELIPIL